LGRRSGKVKEPQAPERARLRPGQLLFAYLHLAADTDQARELLSSGATWTPEPRVSELPPLRLSRPLGHHGPAPHVMGKMIDAQSIVVASTATNWFGHEGSILCFVFWHSIALACLVGLLVMLQAYVPPFTRMVY
jgi:hypothetical protein